MQAKPDAYTPLGMDRRIRERFKDARKRLRRTQPDVARIGGATQGTISKIETDPAYQPSVENFEKALAGINHTILSFYGELEHAQESVKIPESLSLTTPRSEPNYPHPLPISSGGGDAGLGVLSASDSRAVYTAVAHAFAESSAFLLRRRDEIAEPDQPLPTPVRKQSGRGRRGPRNR